ncbi:histidine phosphatase family protein [Paenibacillus flagellatus]|uniref:Histidine phosphatase family protein n=1 Tax=Paenibacillus flagellatus TaxID=2211139 RepID=A0A2V5KB51_9BACL|nr:histidine phosphatase family protein [Paenibacillus flagellatus]PYI55153.1 histidine phosphatase family protein [Paenibacillus flagellatus]
MTIIGLVRHGVTDWNAQMRAQGHTDIPLNETGRRQAERLGERLRGDAWDAVYSSDLGRALETARKAVAGRGLEIETDVRLREVFLGEIEGMTIEERVNKWGENWHSLDLGAEPRDAVAERGAQAIAEIADRHPGQRVLVVSHGGLLGLTLKRLVPHVDTSAFLDNTSLSLVRRTEDGRWECDLYNCTKHLADE